jgi:flagellar biosynthesis protein FlhB
MSRPNAEPTEEPTARRSAEARRRGLVAYSHDLTGAVALAAGLGALVAWGPAIAGELAAYLAAALRRAVAVGASAPLDVARPAFETAIKVLAAPVAAAFLAAAGVALLQTGGLLAIAPVRPDLRRLSAGAALVRMLSGRAMGDTLKGVVKVALLSAVAWWTLRPAIIARAGVTGLAGATPGRVLGAFGALAQRLSGRIALAALGIGIIDYLLARARHRRSLRMTRQEVERERNEVEGNAVHREERRRLYRELSAQRTVADVGRADFVVVAPDVVAVAVAYQPGGSTAPVVLARGERRLAETLAAAARRAGVPIVGDAALARALRDVPEGGEIPEPLYKAVAQTLKAVAQSNDGASRRHV